MTELSNFPDLLSDLCQRYDFSTDSLQNMTAKAILALLLITAISYAADSVPTKDLFEIRQVFEQPSADTIELELSRGALQEVLYVSKKPVLTQTAVQSASAGHDPLTGAPQIEIILTKPAQKTFSDLTRTNIGQRVAILLNGKVQNAPVIRQQISGGRIMITGNFNEDRARQLTEQINRATKS